MPSTSAAQHRAMEAAAHGHSTLGIPKSVGEEFVAKDDAPQAAGVVFASPKGRVLLMHRNPAETNYGGHWGLPGGKAEAGEDAEAAARREVKEETGYDHTGPLKPMDRVKTPKGMTFTTFAAPVDDEFAPKMADGEHTGFTWADLQHLPRPLHPSVARTLGSHIGVTEDMTPEDWEGLKTGFAKWIAEEEAEPEHAEDDASFEEVKHPRDNEGKFSFSAGNGGKADVTSSGEGSGHPLVPKPMSHSQALRNYSEREIPQGWFVHGRDGRYRGKGDPLDTGNVIQMTRDLDVADQYGPDTGGSVFYLAPSDDSPILDLTSDEGEAALKDIFARDFEGGQLPKELDEAIEFAGIDPDDVDEAWDVVRDGFDPDDLVNSAGWYDTDVVSWLADRFPGAFFKLKDGAIALDPANLQRQEVTPVGSANDSLAMDRDSVREFDKDSGHLHVKLTPISKATVNPYLGEEIPGWETMRLDPKRVYQLYRDPQELAKGAPTFGGKPLLIIHKASSAEDHPREVTVGSVGDNVEFRDPYLMAPLSIWDGEAIDLIESGEQQELSCGYSYDPDMTPGVADGMQYDGVMRNIRGNHVALVSQGRAGPDVLVQDAALNTNGRAGPKTGKSRAQKGNRMSKETVRTARGALDAKAKDELEANAALPMGGKAKDKARDEEPDKMEKLRAALKEKGASDDMIDAACDAMMDDEDDEDQEAMDEGDKEDDRKATDEESKEEMVTKKAMDEAISSAVKHANDETLRTQRQIREAEEVVRPYVGKLATVHDSAADVYRTALGALGMKNVEKLHPDALKPILLNMPLPGATARPAQMTMDAAGVNSFYEVFPEAKAHQVKTI